MLPIVNFHMLQNSLWLENPRDYTENKFHFSSIGKLPVLYNLQSAYIGSVALELSNNN